MCIVFVFGQQRLWSQPGKSPHLSLMLFLHEKLCGFLAECFMVRMVASRKTSASSLATGKAKGEEILTI